MKTIICVAIIWLLAGLSLYALGVALAAESASQPVPFMAKFVSGASALLGVFVLLVQIAGGESWLEF